MTASIKKPKPEQALEIGSDILPSKFVVLERKPGPFLTQLVTLLVSSALHSALSKLHCSSGALGWWSRDPA